MPVPLIPGAEALLLGILPPASLCALRATGKRWRQQMQTWTHRLQLTASQDIPLLLQQGWPQLTHLTLNKSPVGQLHIAMLAQARQASLPALTHLTIINHPMVTAAALQELAGHEWSVLQHLDLGHAVMKDLCAHYGSPAAACRCLAAGTWPQLTSLNLSGNNILGAEVAELAKGTWPMLQVLNLSPHQQWSSLLVQELAAASWTTLTDLNLSGAWLDAQETFHLQSAHWPHLTKLNLSECLKRWSYTLPLEPGVSVQEQLLVSYRYVSAGCWPKLFELDMSCNDITAATMALLVKGNWPALSRLKLQRSARHFLGQLAAAQWPALQALDVSWNKVSELDLRQLSQISQLQLTALDLHRLQIFDDTLDMEEHDNWWQLLQSQWPLLKLRMSGADPDCVDMVCAGWSSLKWLDVSDMPLTPDELYGLLKAPALDTLYASCDATYATSAKPVKDEWPSNTFLDLTADFDVEVLQSLSAEFWPACKIVLRYVEDTEKATLMLIEMSKFDLTFVEDLDLSSVFACCESIEAKCPHCQQVLPGAASVDVSTDLAGALRLLSTCMVTLSALRKLDLSCNELGDSCMLLLVAGKWPLLEMLDLRENLIGMAGMKQLTNAAWPMLTKLVLLDNAFVLPTDPGYLDNFARVKKQILGHLTAKWPHLLVYFDSMDVKIVGGGLESHASPRTLPIIYSGTEQRYSGMKFDPVLSCLLLSPLQQIWYTPAAIGINTRHFRPICFVLELVVGSSADQHTLNRLSTTDYSTSARGSATCNDDIDALHCNAYHTALQHHASHSITLFYPRNFWIYRPRLISSPIFGVAL